jgi:hypothetical protein
MLRFFIVFANFVVAIIRVKNFGRGLGSCPNGQGGEAVIGRTKERVVNQQEWPCVQPKAATITV